VRSNPLPQVVGIRIRRSSGSVPPGFSQAGSGDFSFTLPSAPISMSVSSIFNAVEVSGFRESQRIEGAGLLIASESLRS
jgi:hypothetical protein